MIKSYRQLSRSWFCDDDECETIWFGFYRADGSVIDREVQVSWTPHGSAELSIHNAGWEVFAKMGDLILGFGRLVDPEPKDVIAVLEACGYKDATVEVDPEIVNLVNLHIGDEVRDHNGFLSYIVSLEPFVTVSGSGDMVWGKLEPERVKATGVVATDETLRLIIRRYEVYTIFGT